MIKNKKILYIAPRYFYPANDWAKIVFYNTIKELSKTNELDFITNISKEDFKYNFKEVHQFFDKFWFDFRDVTKQNFKDLFLAFIFNQSYFWRKYHTNKFKKMIDEALSKKDYDIIWLETAFCTGYAEYIKEKKPLVKIVSRSHNVESLLLERIASEEKNFIKRYLIKREAVFWKEIEFENLRHVDKLLTITQNDAEYFLEKDESLKTKTEVLLPWVDFEKYQFTHLTKEKNLVFIGSMDYFPNLQAVNWFKENVFDEILKKDKEIKFYIIWKNAPKYIKKMASQNIIVEDWKNKDTLFFDKARIFVVPLLSWSWLKLKVLNALAMWKPILSTRIWLEGIDLENEKEVFCYDDPGSWIDTILKNISKSETLETIAENWRKFAEKNFSWEKNMKDVNV